MRRLNTIVVIGIFIAFLIHAIMGSLRLAGANVGMVKIIAWVCAALICVHAVIVTIMTCQTLYARKRSGAGYFKDNLLFWVRRISGFAIFVPLVMHIAVFSPANEAVYRLREFNTGRLISQILLVASIALHVLTNIKPLMLSLGIRKYKEFILDVLLVLAVLLLLFSVAFVIYYLRWVMF